MYAATGGPNVKWGGTDFKWGRPSTTAPPLVTALRRIYFEKPNPEMFFCKKLLKKKRHLKKIVIEQF